MNNHKINDEWEKIPNKLYVSKGSFIWTPQYTEGIKNTVGIEVVNILDNFFKKRWNKRLNPRDSYCNGKAHSEIFINKQGVGIYCFDKIILPPEKYIIDSQEIDLKKDYTIMLLTELVQTDVSKVITGNEMNREMHSENLRRRSELRLKELRKINKNKQRPHY